MNPNHDSRGEFAASAGTGGSRSFHRNASSAEHAKHAPAKGAAPMQADHRIRNTIIGALAGSAVMPIVGTVVGGAIGYQMGKPS